MVTSNDLSFAIGVVEELLPVAKRLYIGRSNFPERRLLQHRADRGFNKLFAVYWTPNPRDAAYLEEALIERFDDVEQLENAAYESLGAWGAGNQAVYVTWT